MERWDKLGEYFFTLKWYNYNNMSYTHSQEIRKKMSENRTGVSCPRKNSQYKHLQRTGFYYSWCQMKARCNNPHSKSYTNYGGRGITVCKEWLSFENFYKDLYVKWLFHSKLFKSTSIDRIDNNGNYCKENCRWATSKVQSNNRRSNRMLEHCGQVLNVKEWSEKLGIKQTTITQRLDYYGWSVERALTT